MARANTERDAMRMFTLAVVAEKGEEAWTAGEVIHIASYEEDDDDGENTNLIGDFINYNAPTLRGRTTRLGHFL